MFCEVMSNAILYFFKSLYKLGALSAIVRSIHSQYFDTRVKTPGRPLHVSIPHEPTPATYQTPSAKQLMGPPESPYKNNMT